MPAQRTKLSQGVALPAGFTGSSLLHRVLKDAIAQYPDVFGSLRIPERSDAFKAEFGDLLTRFEAARVSSTRRSEVARFLFTQSQQALRFRRGEEDVPLAEWLSVERPSAALEYGTHAGDPQFQVAVPFGGRVYRGAEVLSLVDRLTCKAALSASAAAGLRWMVEHVELQGGRLDLRGQRFVLLGAGAELAPTEALLRAGATVLWVDLSSPEALTKRCGGGLVSAQGASDLLTAPEGVAAAIRTFANQHGPVHMGLFAYAAGESQEWRLCAAMNSILTHMAPSDVASAALFISPTAPHVRQPEAEAAAAAQLAERSVWKGMLTRAGMLPQPGAVGEGELRVARAIVSIQGVSYQAAQYISKIAAAETWATHGIDLSAQQARPLLVSANVAGITRTRSLSHPLFEAAFVGAPHFGVEIFEPATTAALSGLLMLHDLLNPEAPAAQLARSESPEVEAAKLFQEQIHGGTLGLPYALEPAIRVAAAIGLGRRPQVLWPRAQERRA